MSAPAPRVAILIAAGFEDRELTEPYRHLTSSGFSTTLIGLTESDREGVIGKHGTTHAAQATIAEVSADDFDAVLIPGGKAPARLRQNELVLDFIREMDRQGKTVAAICHGPQVLASAGILNERTVTGFFTIRREIRRTGGRFVNRAVTKDGNLITSRKPGDVPKFIDALIEALGKPASMPEGGSG